MTVAEILRRKQIKNVETVSPSACIADAAATLSKMRIGALICSEDGKSVSGMISERDIIRVLGADGPGCLDRKISAIMTSKVQTCAPDATVESVLGRMSEGRFRHMPVVSDGTLVGLVSIGDLVQARIDDLEHETTALADMIKGY
ncbi:CBS domain-containing protein [Rhodovulum sp. DZ06]|uniref:CBS domain-containing protein n=1 Tax=Rhodovulum sp. DZ06 TaxID=3425126 RepID=UPI003D3496A6